MADPRYRGTLITALTCTTAAFSALGVAVSVSRMAALVLVSLAVTFGAAAVIAFVTAWAQTRRHAKETAAETELVKWEPVRRVMQEFAELSDYLSVVSDSTIVSRERSQTVVLVGRAKMALEGVDPELRAAFHKSALPKEKIPPTATALGRYLRTQRRALEGMLPANQIEEWDTSL